MFYRKNPHGYILWLVTGSKEKFEDKTRIIYVWGKNSTETFEVAYEEAFRIKKYGPLPVRHLRYPLNSLYRSLKSLYRHDRPCYLRDKQIFIYSVNFFFPSPGTFFILSIFTRLSSREIPHSRGKIYIGGQRGCGSIRRMTFRTVRPRCGCKFKVTLYIYSMDDSAQFFRHRRYQKAVVELVEWTAEAYRQTLYYVSRTKFAYGKLHRVLIYE